MANRLDGRVAIVTGAGRGIGRGVALQMADEGAAVVIADFGGNLDGSGGDAGPADEVANEIKAQGGRAIAHYGDVSKFADTKDLVDTTLREFGRVDILCHVAGILRDRMVFNMTEEEWDAVLAVHLKGAFNTTRNAIVPMLKQGYGRVLLFSSGSGLGSTGQANYSAAKEGMVGLARALSREVGPYGIAVNAIYPGGNTRMTQSVPDTAAQIRAAAGIQRAGRAQTMTSNGDGGPTPRDPENNAPPVAWLCTEAGGAVSGQVIGTSGWQASRYSPRQVIRSVHQARHWTVDELAQAVPGQLVAGITNPAPKQQPREEAAPVASS
ncbi:MAG: SDR family NAD(P)-dependent oxidoreductase [Dehalococcoidia bacterium]|nr:SDR family NAD(P)-dependent oxidoreductase [Dehalococcoidia bacterium]